MLLQSDIHPQLDMLDHWVRILGWPTFLGAFAWALRKWDAGQRELKLLHTNTDLAVQGVQQVQKQVEIMQSNHLAHLQEGINKVAQSNDEAVKVLQNIDKTIGIVLDRVAR